MRIGRTLSRVLAPGYSWCMKCETAWRFVEPRTVEFHEVTQEIAGRTITFKQRGHFALCEECWDECDADERVRYHVAAMREYGGWDEIEAAEVLANVRADSA